MIRSDLRTTAPTSIPGLQSLLKGDVIFTNFEGTVAQAGQSVHERRGFLAPPEALDALQAVGFNLLALSDNHAFNLKVDGFHGRPIFYDLGNFILQRPADADLH